MSWRDAVLAALARYADRHSTAVVDRGAFLKEELAAMVRATGSRGATPHKTVDRHLQEVRDAGVVRFLSRGRYLLLDREVRVDAEDYDGETLEGLLEAGRLLLPDVPTGDRTARTRRRRGQAKLRRLNRAAYGGRCAACDVTDRRLLVTSHIVRWADAPKHRGRLANVLCLCRPHDALFEEGYWSLGDDLTVIVRHNVGSITLRDLLTRHTRFRPPARFPPTPAFLAAHRARVGL